MGGGGGVTCLCHRLVEQFISTMEEYVICELSTCEYTDCHSKSKASFCWPIIMP